MASKRVESGRGRKSGVVKASKQSTANRLFYIIIALVAVGGIGALTYASARDKGATAVTRVDTTLPPVQSEGYVLGSPTAPLEVVEFGDFECPGCSRFATVTEPDVRSRLISTGQIRLRYIDFPLDMHPNSWNASRAAACADEQGKFWEMHDALFQTQDQWAAANGNTKPDGFFKDLAKQLRLDAGRFNDCVDTKKYQAKIQAHLKIGLDRKINGTPTFIIGDSSAAVIPYDYFKKLVDVALAKSGAPKPAVSGDTATRPALKSKK
jgi:protein-disulfide isomerase